MPEERIVVTGTMTVQVDDAEAVVAALRGQVPTWGGMIASEQVTGAASSWRASLRLRIPPGEVAAAAAWIGERGEITAKHIQGDDVSRTLFDHELALGNLRVTLERMRALLDGGGLGMDEILAVEREMTRLRGEIERIEGDKRFLEDRVQLATLDVELRNRDGAVLGDRAKVFPGPRVAMLTMFGKDHQRTRLGGGMAMHLVVPRLTLELDVFDDVAATETRAAEGHAVVATYGGAGYSDFLGRGKRRFLNPYLGARMGYGYLDRHAFILQGEAGVELFKHKYGLIDLGVRATAFIGKQFDAGLITGASAVFAF